MLNPPPSYYSICGANVNYSILDVKDLNNQLTEIPSNLHPCKVLKCYSNQPTEIPDNLVDC